MVRLTYEMDKTRMLMIEVGPNQIKVETLRALKLKISKDLCYTHQLAVASRHRCAARWLLWVTSSRHVRKMILLGY